MIARLIEDRLDMVVAARIAKDRPPTGGDTGPATGC